MLTISNNERYDLRSNNLMLMLQQRKTNAFQFLVITTKTGKVQGVVEPSSISGKDVQKFSNIPYAEAPIGKLRFAKPEPKKPWNGTLKSTNVSVACWQTSQRGEMSEDCLVLNVWTPYPQKTNQSVMIWIHGGSFKYGSAGGFPGHNVVAVGDVVYVAINYRLSALGFLTTGDGRIKGNFGLFDQRLAMKWVKENIASFGGDPQSITIFGLSAGGASVSAHTLSNGSWPYFNRAIMQSGGLNMPWATARKESIDHALDTFLDIWNCPNDGTLLECLRNMTEKDVENAYITNAKRLTLVWTPPVVDGDFITDVPSTLLRHGRMKDNNVIMGITKDEQFSMFAKMLLTSKNIDEFSEKLDEVVKTYLRNSSVEAFDEAIQLYSPNKDFQSKKEALRPIIDFSSDFWFICSVRDEAIARSQALKSSVYFYRYSYASDIPMTRLYPNGTFGFAAHALDVISIIGVPVNNSIYPSEDQILSMRMILYWTNFAKNGDPNIGTTKLPIVLNGVDNLPEWPKFTNATRKYLDMESGSRMVVRKRLREKYCEFLKDPEGFIRRKETSVGSKCEAPAMLLLFLLPFLKLVLQLSTNSFNYL